MKREILLRRGIVEVGQTGCRVKTQYSHVGVLPLYWVRWGGHLVYESISLLSTIERAVRMTHHHGRRSFTTAENTLQAVVDYWDYSIDGRRDLASAPAIGQVIKDLMTHDEEMESWGAAIVDDPSIMSHGATHQDTE